MNDYYYYTLICPFIKKEDRVICQKSETYLMAYKNKKKQHTLALIYIHQGSPCYRFCICKYFSKDETIKIYSDIKI
jgi:hypothetical protein